MPAHEVRASFLRYFAERGHEIRESSSLVPANDPTLIFTNAGMVQFKGVFLGEEQTSFKRAVTSQRCVRAGGKHNDLEEVGNTARHHTFFEMLGNFSFGDYFKREAIGYAWELMTAEYGLEPDRLYATVHHTDGESARLWSKEAGVPPGRVHRLGDKDNFWQMADTGPCGPCSELHYDLRAPGAPVPATTEEFVALNDEGSILELWNLVFMQFDRSEGGELAPLPAQSVDTGAGLERIAAVVQRADSNFHTDLFAPLLERIGELVGRSYEPGSDDAASYRVIADHARAVAFLLADGVTFRNEGRGYVLRRILRRGVRHAWLLGRRSPTLAPVVDVVADAMSEAFPALSGRGGELAAAARAEEERFLATIEGGMGRLEELTTGSGGTISGTDAFRLYDTFGFPLDLTRLVARESGYGVDDEGFHRALRRQRERSRRARRKGTQRTAGGEWRPPLDVLTGGERTQRFVGYARTCAETELLAIREAGERLSVVLSENPFYREAGGQVSDEGRVVGDGWELLVDSAEEAGGATAVSGRWRRTSRDEAGALYFDGSVRAEVDTTRRLDVERNHTATHLLHAALGRVLGGHVRQMGSLVAPDRLRFDFSHAGPMTAEEREAVEGLVNEAVWADHPVKTTERDAEDARAAGAKALFGEKYGDVVRVVEIPGVSMELCGGTHVRSTAAIGLFRIVSESGVSAGVRRAEALTGRTAFEYLRERERTLDDAARTLRTDPGTLRRRIDELVDQRDALDRLLTELRAGKGREAGRELVRAAIDLPGGGAALYLGVSAQCHDSEDARSWGDRFLAEEEAGAAVLGAVLSNGQRALFAFVSTDLISRGLHAGRLVGEIAAVAGGRGGGRAHLGQAGVGDPARLHEAVRSGEGIVRARLREGAAEEDATGERE